MILLGGDHLILRGRGAGKFGRDRVFIFDKSSAGKLIYFQVLPRLEYLLSSATKFWESKNKKGKKNPKTKGEGGMLVQKGGKTGFSM